MAVLCILWPNLDAASNCKVVPGPTTLISGPTSVGLLYNSANLSNLSARHKKRALPPTLIKKGKVSPC